MKFPSIAHIAACLRDLNANVEGECDVRLQVYADGVWAIHYGDSSYDLDHRGFWGASCVPGVVNGRVTRFRSRDIAKDLLEQAKDAYAQSEAFAKAV